MGVTIRSFAFYAAALFFATAATINRSAPLAASAFVFPAVYRQHDAFAVGKLPSVKLKEKESGDVGGAPVPRLPRRQRAPPKKRRGRAGSGGGKTAAEGERGAPSRVTSRGRGAAPSPPEEVQQLTGPKEEPRAKEKSAPSPPEEEQQPTGPKEEPRAEEKAAPAVKPEEKESGDAPVSPAPPAETILTDYQRDFFRGYLNEHHAPLLLDLAAALTAHGPAGRRRNALTRGSYALEGARITDIPASGDEILLEVTVSERGKRAPSVHSEAIPLDASVPASMARAYPAASSLPPSADVSRHHPVDAFVRRFSRLCRSVARPSATGKLLLLGHQIGGEAPLLLDNMFLNVVPHGREIRQYFYGMASAAVLEAVQLCSDGRVTHRLRLDCTIPELNVDMDSYRIGTLLELARDVALTLAEQNLRVRICVQGSMGVGIFTATPKSLAGVATLLRRMDWQSGEGEENEGILGDFINFGDVCAECVQDEERDADGAVTQHQDDVFLLICPQSMVGVDASIIQPLSEMVKAAGDRPMILINPSLADRPSSNGQQGVRGRAERLAFAASFQTVYHAHCMYDSSTGYFPILGMMLRRGVNEPWVAYQRRDFADGIGEAYVPLLATERDYPDGAEINDAYARSGDWEEKKS